VFRLAAAPDALCLAAELPSPHDGPAIARKSAIVTQNEAATMAVRNAIFAVGRRAMPASIFTAMSLVIVSDL
jgi:hypothetical protein